MTFNKRRYDIFRLPLGYIILVVFSITLMKCGTNDSSSLKEQTNEKLRNIESNFVELPDTFRLRQLLKTGNK